MLPSRLLNWRTSYFCELWEQPSHLMQAERFCLYTEKTKDTQGSLLFRVVRWHRKRKLTTSRAQCISWTDFHMVTPNCFVMRLKIRIKRLNWSVDAGDRTVEPQPHFTTSIGLKYEDRLNGISPLLPNTHLKKESCPTVTYDTRTGREFSCSEQLSFSIRVVIAILH